ncbi:MAG: glycosyltransferase family 39 protein [Candidatus Doudnabacteria bacterium]|nr:glycosyltransferase family 39 protein [Candidatus Doudnabacteria bacterium]
MAKFLKARYILLGVIAIAAFFRFWQINSLPGGLFPDEAANGLDINLIFQGQAQPFFERGNGREALFFYLLAIPVSLFGRGPWQHHIVSAGLGLAATILTYFLAKRMFGKNTALLATFFMAISSFAVTISRTAFRANLVPVFTTLTLFFLVRFFQIMDHRSRITNAFLAGISFGLGFYSYISFRMMVPLLLFFGCVLLYGFRDQFHKILKEYWKPKLYFAAGFLLSFAWIGIYFLTHPGTFVGRAGQVSIFNPDLNGGDLWSTVLLVFKQTILSFFTQGDLNWRHNVSGYPFLSPFLSPFFAIALVVSTVAVFRLLKDAYKKQLSKPIFYQALVACWFWAMLIPELVTAEGIPHGLRLIGVIPPIFILAAIGVDWAWQKISQIEYFYNSKIAFASIFLATIFLYNFYLYFAVAATSPEYYYAFRSDLTDVSKYLNERNNKPKTFLSLDAFSVQTVDYLTTARDNPYSLVVPEKTFEVNLIKGDQVVFTQSTIFDAVKFVEYHPQAKLAKELKNKWDQTIMLVYQQP